VNRKVPNLHLQAKGNGVDAADLGTASGDAFNLGDEAAPDQRLE
jgi:hypothetical protein